MKKGTGNRLSLELLQWGWSLCRCRGCLRSAAARATFPTTRADRNNVQARSAEADALGGPAGRPGPGGGGAGSCRSGASRDAVEESGRGSLLAFEGGQQFTVETQNNPDELAAASRRVDRARAEADRARAQAALVRAEAVTVPVDEDARARADAANQKVVRAAGPGEALRCRCA